LFQSSGGNFNQKVLNVKISRHFGKIHFNPDASAFGRKPTKSPKISAQDFLPYLPEGWSIVGPVPIAVGYDGLPFANCAWLLYGTVTAGMLSGVFTGKATR
jgi:hypothetical protein